MTDEIAGKFTLPLDAAATQQLVWESLLGDRPLPQPVEVPSGKLYASCALGDIGASVAAIGAFDGLHRGHRALLSAAKTDAAERHLPCIAITFAPDPSEVLSPEHPEPRLLSCEDRIRGLLHLGADAVLCVPFTEEFMQLAPEAFLGRIVDAVHPASLHVGTNFRFGYKGEGTISTLEELGPRFGMGIMPQDLSCEGAGPISATRIRTLLATPDGLEAGTKLLGRCHFVRGTVIHGRGEGTGMGFATANVQCAPISQMPAEGVYGGYVVVEGTPWAAAINVGAPKSFEDDDRPDFLEAHLLDFVGDIYGREVEVIFCAWLRAARRFSSLEELEQVVRQNIEWVKANLSAQRGR